MEGIKTNLERSIKFLLGFLKWVGFAIITGITGGFVGSLLSYATNYATEYRTYHQNIFWLLPIAGLAIVFIYKISDMENDEGTNLVISSIRSGNKIPANMAPLIFVAAVITHFFGGSAGRTGAALQIGASVSSTIGRVMKLSKNDINIITMCGMSALFSSLFGTPLAATIFAMEVVSVGVMYYAAFVPCLFSAIVACNLASGLGVEGMDYSFVKQFNLSNSIMVKVVILGALCAVVGMIFCIAMNKTGNLAKKYIKNPYIRIFVGGVLIVVLTLLVGNHDYNGLGVNIIDRAMLGQGNDFAFLLKILFTVITISAGFKGGEILPSFFIGATFGCAVAPVLGMNTTLGAALGFIAVFCAVVNCPIASIVLSLEIFGSQNMLLFAIVCAVSYMMSGYYSLFSSQKIVYSKLRPHFININANNRK